MLNQTVRKITAIAASLFGGIPRARSNATLDLAALLRSRMSSLVSAEELKTLRVVDKTIRELRAQIAEYGTDKLKIAKLKGRQNFVSNPTDENRVTLDEAHDISRDGLERKFAAMRESIKEALRKQANEVRPIIGAVLGRAAVIVAQEIKAAVELERPAFERYGVIYVPGMIVGALQNASERLVARSTQFEDAESSGLASRPSDDLAGILNFSAELPANGESPINPPVAPAVQPTPKRKRRDQTPEEPSGFNKAVAANPVEVPARSSGRE
jgi:hypothetical protein